MKLRRILLPATSLALLALASPALAEGPPYTVKVGTYTAGTHNIYVATTGPVTFATRSQGGGAGLSVNCYAMYGNALAYAGSSKNPVLDVTNMSGSGCSTVYGATEVRSQGKWPFVGTGTNATAADSDFIASQFTNVTLRVTSFTSVPCSFTISGKLVGNYSESGLSIDVNEQGFAPSLVASNVSGCGGRVANGSTVSATVHMFFQSPDGRINLS